LFIYYNIKKTLIVTIEMAVDCQGQNLLIGNNRMSGYFSRSINYYRKSANMALWINLADLSTGNNGFKTMILFTH